MSNPTDSQKLRVNPVVDDDETVAAPNGESLLQDANEDPVYNKGPRRIGRPLWIGLGLIAALAVIYGIGMVASRYGSRITHTAKVTKSSPVTATPTAAVTLTIDSKLSLEEQNDVLLHFAENAQAWMTKAKSSNDALRAENAALKKQRSKAVIAIAVLAPTLFGLALAFFVEYRRKRKAQAAAA